MELQELISLLETKHKDLVRIKINGNYYRISYILDYNLDEEILDETVLGCFDIEDNCIVDYEFTLNDLLNSEVKFYEYKEVQL